MEKERLPIGDQNAKKMTVKIVHYKHQALEEMQAAVEAMQQIVATTDMQSLKLASERLQQAMRQLNELQGNSDSNEEM